MTLPGDGPLHPRPHFTRPRWTELGGRWAFAYDDADAGGAGGWQDREEVFDRTIVVPFPPESVASGIGDPGYHPVVWYRRTFSAADTGLRAGERLVLHFGAVDYRAQVWVNGQLVVTHEGGHTPFSADITSALRSEDGDATPQVLVVRAEDRPLDLEQPRGKQDWQERPHSIWYCRTTGIWQPVWLEPVPATRVESLRWTPDLERATLGLAVRVTRADERPLRVRVRLSQHGRVLAEDVYSVEGSAAERYVALPQSGTTLGRRTLLWAPEHPNLIDAVVTLIDGDGDGGGFVDEVGSYAAMRSIAASHGRILLNERPYFLRLVLAQNYWPESHLAAPSPEALRREVELVKSLGFNGVRLHQKLEDPRFLAWCDRLGLLVWAEMPAAYVFSPRAVERVTREWLEALARDYSAPCVIAWVPINESWGVPALERSAEQRHLVRALYHLTKAVDPTRPVVGNDGWEQVVSDVVTVHDYTAEGATLRERYGTHQAVEETLHRVQPSHRPVLLPGVSRGEEPVMVSEFGGITFSATDGDTWPGYGTVASAELLLERYRSLVDALLDSPAVTGFCYTQLTDTAQERNGLLTEYREPKLDPEVIRGINRRYAAAVPGDSIHGIELGALATPLPGTASPGETPR